MSHARALPSFPPKRHLLRRQHEAGQSRTRDKAEARGLLHAKNEARRQPIFNLHMARTYVAAADPAMTTRIWQNPLDYMVQQAVAQPTRERLERAFACDDFDHLRAKVIVETTVDDFRQVFTHKKPSSIHYLRNLHNLAQGLNWLPWAIVGKKLWPCRCARCQPPLLSVCLGSAGENRRLSALCRFARGWSIIGSSRRNSFSEGESTSTMLPP